MNYLRSSSEHIYPHGSPELIVVGGSHAQGMATETSDYDINGFYEIPVETLLGFRGHKETIDGHDPFDYTFHTADKFCKLALAANPTILETLVSTFVLYESPLAVDLKDNVDAFLSKQVRRTFGGYANQQFQRLTRRGSFSSTLRNRTKKHARHLVRLLQVGELLLTTGELDIVVRDRDDLFEFGELPEEKMIAEARVRLDRFDSLPCVLPDKADGKRIEDIVIGHRLDRIRA